MLNAAPDGTADADQVVSGHHGRGLVHRGLHCNQVIDPGHHGPGDAGDLPDFGPAMYCVD